ncbi:MAG: flagellar motor protein MotB [Nitrospinae bacterium]|nr:flagellar motor protein MotB [Nitrospinota bacterium]
MYNKMISIASFLYIFLNTGYLHAQDMKFNSFHTNSEGQVSIFDLDKFKTKDLSANIHYKKHYSDGFSLFREGRYSEAHIKFTEAKDSLESLGMVNDIYYAVTLHSLATSYLWAINFDDVKADSDFMKKLVALEEKAMNISRTLINSFPENKGFLANQLITAGQISFKVGDIQASNKYFLAAMRHDPQNKTASDYMEMIRAERRKQIEKKSYNDKDGENDTELYRIKKEMDELVSQIGIQDKIYTKLEGKDLTVVNSDPLTFKSGDSDINPSVFPFIDKIVMLLNKFPYNIRVEGHTDSTPIHNSQFSSNYELSFARANNFVNYLVSKGIDPRRCTAAGYGESNPLYPEDTSENREKNRRIEITFESVRGEPQLR